MRFWSPHGAVGKADAGGDGEENSSPALLLYQRRLQGEQTTPSRPLSAAFLA